MTGLLMLAAKAAIITIVVLTILLTPAILIAVKRRGSRVNTTLASIRKRSPKAKRQAWEDRQIAELHADISRIEHGDE